MIMDADTLKDCPIEPRIRFLVVTLKYSLAALLLPVLLAAPGITAGATCFKTSEVCVDGPATKTISGEPVTRACWKYEAQYECLTGTTSDCAPLLSAGCSQIGSTCIQKLIDGQCSLWAQKYQCQTSKGVSSTVVDCGSNAFCMDGKCFDAKSTPNPDFGLAATSLNILFEAGKDFDSTLMQIFKGSAMACQRTGGIFGGIANCCSDSGWAVGLGLEGCSEEEKALGPAREAKITHYVGEECTSSTLFGMCTKYKQTFCKFNSKLARLLQEQGRPQLGLGWGSPDAPDCRGLTPAEIQTLDFSKMDLSEFYTDAMLKAKELDPAQMGTAVGNRVTNYFSSGTHKHPGKRRGAV
ncbi:MAG: conjugal transfer protein TraN [Pseudomonadota bacterium]